LAAVALQMAPAAELLSLELKVVLSILSCLLHALSLMTVDSGHACLSIYVRVLPALLSSDGLSISNGGWLCLLA
jgi:hypothetical protein